MYRIIHFNFFILTWAFNCKLPNSCKLKHVHLHINYLAHEKTSIEMPGILCDIRDEKYQFTYPMPSSLLRYNNCAVDLQYNDIIEFRFHSSFIMSKRFNITNLFDYSWYFVNYMHVNFVNLKGFELDMINNQHIRFMQQLIFNTFNCIKCQMEFYSNDGRIVKTCQDIIDSNNGLVRSLFQIRRYKVEGLKSQSLALFDSQFKTTLCPLVFMNSNLPFIYIIGLADTFYKRNILAFENRTFEHLNSTINQLFLIKIEHINIDSNLLNPSVFQDLNLISFSGAVNTIDGNSLNALKSLNQIYFSKNYYRDMIHKNGIEWIRDLNSDLDVNWSNFTELQYRYYNNKRQIFIDTTSFSTEIRLSKLFPDKDFCIYKDFPFSKLVILMELVFDDKVLSLINSTNHYTCTYLWLAQYFKTFFELER